MEKVSISITFLQLLRFDFLLPKNPLCKEQFIKILLDCLFKGDIEIRLVLGLDRFNIIFQGANVGLVMTKKFEISVLEGQLSSLNLRHNKREIQQIQILTPSVFDNNSSRWILGPHDFKTKRLRFGRVMWISINKDRCMIRMKSSKMMKRSSWKKDTPLSIDKPTVQVKE